MPGVRRRGGPVVRARKLDPLELLKFGVGIGALYEGDEETAAAIYALNREALLTCGNWSVLSCQPFWRFEGPPSCRDESEPDLDYIDGGPEAMEKLERRRLAWLLGPGRPLFDGLPNGEQLYQGLQARQIAEEPPQR